MRKALLLAAAMPLLAGVPAEATRVRACVATANVTFSPPLTLDPRSGTVTWTYTNTCGVAYTTGASGVDTYTNTLVYGYSGSCTTATLSRPGTIGLIVGGTSATFVVTSPNTGVASWALIAGGLNPCAMASASAVGVSGDVL